MAERAFLDTNIAVYLLADDPAKAAQAEELLATRPCISTQVVNEFINVCTRKLRFDRAAAHAGARALMAHCEVLPVSARTVDTAMRLGVNYPSGPIAWGERLGWQRLLTLLENLQRHYGEERYRPCSLLRQRALLESSYES